MELVLGYELQIVNIKCSISFQKIGSKYNPDIKGKIKIISELEYCKSCTGIIQQFNEMFPNVKITLIDGVK